ncbi:MAG: M28 family peptidase, partial [Armatimonadota bacterium]|nr:M28 family peptidase [Armatimonadota bacterium]
MAHAETRGGHAARETHRAADGEVDLARIARHLRALSFPRRTGGPGESRAVAFLCAALRGLGLQPRVEPFLFSPLALERVLPSAMLCASALVLLAARHIRPSPRRAGEMLTLGFAAGLPAMRWTGFTERMLDLPGALPSQNLVVELPSLEESESHLVLMAHYDSKSQRLPGPVRWGLALAAVGGAAALLYTTARCAPRHLPPPRRTMWLAGISAAALAALAVNKPADRSPGALDNAAGLAVWLELARAFATDRPRRTRITLVATGAEEEGLAGAVRFFQTHKEEIGPHPWVINLDAVGSKGPLAILSASGVPPLSTGAPLARRLRHTAHELGIPARVLWMPPGIATDHL